MRLTCFSAVNYGESTGVCFSFFFPLWGKSIGFCLWEKFFFVVGTVLVFFFFCVPQRKHRFFFCFRQSTLQVFFLLGRKVLVRGGEVLREK